jgi:hypothetical protein
MNNGHNKTTHRLTAFIKTVLNPFRHCPIRIQESAVDQAPKVENTAYRRGVPTLIDTCRVIPLIASRLQ